MSRRTLRHGAAALALLSVLGGGGALAQTATSEPPVVTAPATPAPAITAETLPDALRALNLTDLDIRSGRRGITRVQGKTADGAAITAMVDADGAVRMVRGTDDAALPQALIDALLPQPVRANELVGQFAAVSGLAVMTEMVMIGGKDAAGESLRAGFAPDGTLMRFGRGEDRMHRDRDGKRGFDRHHRGEGRGWDRGDRRGWHQERGDRDNWQGRRDEAPARGVAPTGAPLDEAALRQALTGAGYTDLGALQPQGPRVLVDAVNANGEAVSVEVNPMGQVVRETAR